MSVLRKLIFSIIAACAVVPLAHAGGQGQVQEVQAPCQSRLPHANKANVGRAFRLPCGHTYCTNCARSRFHIRNNDDEDNPSPLPEAQQQKTCNVAGCNQAMNAGQRDQLLELVRNVQAGAAKAAAAAASPAPAPEEEPVCAVCRDKFISPFPLTCGPPKNPHRFCVRCLLNAFGSPRERCPFCNEWVPYHLREGIRAAAAAAPMRKPTPAPAAVHHAPPASVHQPAPVHHASPVHAPAPSIPHVKSDDQLCAELWMDIEGLGMGRQDFLTQLSEQFAGGDQQELIRRRRIANEIFDAMAQPSSAGADSGFLCHRRPLAAMSGDRGDRSSVLLPSLGLIGLLAVVVYAVYRIFNRPKSPAGQNKKPVAPHAQVGGHVPAGQQARPRAGAAR